MGEGGGRAIGRMGPGNAIKLTTVQYRIQSTSAAKLWYIKLPMFLIWCLDLLIFMRANPLLFCLDFKDPPRQDVPRHINSRYINSDINVPTCLS